MGLSNRQPGAPSGKSQQPPAPSTAQQQINSWGGQPSGAMQPAQQGGLGAQFGTQQEAMMGQAQTGQAPTSLGMQTGSTAQAMMGGNYGGNIADRQMPGGMGDMTPAYANDAQQAQQAMPMPGGDMWNKPMSGGRGMGGMTPMQPPPQQPNPALQQHMAELNARVNNFGKPPDQQSPPIGYPSDGYKPQPMPGRQPTGGMTPAYVNDAQQAQQALQKAGGVPAYQPRPPVAAAMPPGTAALGGGVAPRRGATLAQALQRRTGNTWK